MTWFQLIAAIALSLALTWLGYVIVIDAKERADESVRMMELRCEIRQLIRESEMELRREIRQLIREAEEVPVDSSAKGLYNCAAVVGYALLAATE